MPGGEFSLQAGVEIDGQPLSADLLPLLEQVVVDDYLHLPDMFVLSFRDVEHKVLADARLKIGGTVTISGGGLGKTPDKLITGEITSLEGEYGPNGARVIARGYDKSHRFHRGRVTETYRNVKYSDIARTVAQRVGVPVGVVDDSGATHDHVSQANISDWDFLRGLAREIGYEVAVPDGKFAFRKPARSSTAPSDGDFDSADPLQLVFGQDLLEFHPRVASAEQVAEVEVRGWDMKAKDKVIGKAKAGTTSTELKATPAAVAKLFGGPRYVGVDRPYSTVAAVEAAATAIADEIGSAMAEAQGVARGDPKLRSGTAVSVGVVSPDFVGKYTLTNCRHIFDAEGYRTSFVISGRHERSLLGLTSGGSTNGTSSAPGRPINGVVVAIVTNNQDPDKLARCKLKFPWLSDTYESDWARLAQLGAGPESGAVFLPEVNDEVLVSFEFGDIRRPYIVGGLWNGKDKPRLGDGLVDNGKVKRRGLISRRGHRAVLFDADGDSGIALITSDNKIRVALKESDKELHLYCEGKVVIESVQDMKLTSKASISIEASTQLSLKGTSGVKLESTGVVDVDGSLIQLN